MLCKSLGIISQIFIYVVFSTATKNVRNFWDVMRQLDEMNRKSLKGKTNSVGISEKDVSVRETAPITSNTVFSDISFLPKTTENTKDVYSSSSERVLSTATERDYADVKVTNEKHFTTSYITGGETTVVTTGPRDILSTKNNNIIHSEQARSISTSRLHNPSVGEKIKSGNNQAGLMYTSVVGGVTLAVLCIVLIIYIRQLRRQNNTKNDRFSTTDQKTYQDTKIFVMGNSEKSEIPSFNAIPPNICLWKELRNTTPNVF